MSTIADTTTPNRTTAGARTSALKNGAKGARTMTAIGATAKRMISHVNTFPPKSGSRKAGTVAATATSGNVIAKSRNDQVATEIKARQRELDAIKRGREDIDQADRRLKNDSSRLIAQAGAWLTGCKA